ncbi:glycoside hydrolase family 5 protein [Pseudomassariella vexata]|uniref:Mannan endo-1,4-beta-mannosidase A n=1 Tax=Pseudomassariella vexata TaxID=1141098 RepID=A0A1Y2D983_9PEZI|nr:glycoside hydrolase family 5 protein [Pseudomassariella vexata]ORY55686.1 glycoside hydrolase family 5 protein [Pseudomassariella vexata]
MKNLTAAFLSLATAASASCVGSKIPTTSSTAVAAQPTTVSSSNVTNPSNSSASSSFAKTNGVLFDIDGVSEYFAGTNCYWCGFLTENGDVDLVFSDIAASGMKIVRVWGFNDVNTKPTDGTVWYQYLSAEGSEINTGVDGLGRLDYVVQAAEANGLKLIINFVNNWSDYGGIAAYSSAFGGDATTWYTNLVAQNQYQAYIEAVVSRYSESTAVFAWELANEPRCDGCDVSVIYNWAANTSAYIKSLDSNHMVTMGDEGFGPLDGDDGSYPYTTSAGGYTWRSNMNITTLDFATLHLYPDSWGQDYSWGTPWVELHGAACAAEGKPCLLEEYGGNNNCTIENPWQDAALATDGIAADMFWQYGDTLPSSGSQTSDDGNTVYYKQGNWDCMVADHITDIKAANAA